MQTKLANVHCECMIFAQVLVWFLHKFYLQCTMFTWCALCTKGLPVFLQGLHHASRFSNTCAMSIYTCIHAFTCMCALNCCHTLSNWCGVTLCVVHILTAHRPDTTHTGTSKHKVNKIMTHLPCLYQNVRLTIYQCKKLYACNAIRYAEINHLTTQGWQADKNVKET